MTNTQRAFALGVILCCLALGACGGDSDGEGGGEPSIPLTEATQATRSTPQSLPVSPVSAKAGCALGRLVADDADGGSHQPPAQPVAILPSINGRAVRGLDNMKGSCFINAALQVIAHDEVLRKRVMMVGGAPEIHAFFDAYDGQNGYDAATLARAHEALVAYIRNARGMPLGAGYTSQVFDVLNADYTYLMLEEQNIILTHLGAGTRYFDVTGVSDQTNRRFDKLPQNAEVTHFVYYTGGHYLTYLKNGTKWIEANDGKIREMDTAQLDTLANVLVSPYIYSGIAFVGYR